MLIKTAHAASNELYTKLSHIEVTHENLNTSCKIQKCVMVQQTNSKLSNKLNRLYEKIVFAKTISSYECQFHQIYWFLQ